MTDETLDDGRELGAAQPEVRTRRLVVVDDQDAERAVIEIVGRHAEVRVIAQHADQRCEALRFAGEDERGEMVAAVELWANGNAIAGQSVSIASGVTVCNEFRTT